VQGLLRDRKTISRQRPGNATIMYKPSSDMRLQDLGCSRGLKRVTQESQQGGLCDVRLACLCAWITWPCMRKGGYGTAENNPAQPIHPAVFETISPSLFSHQHYWLSTNLLLPNLSFHPGAHPLLPNPTLTESISQSLIAGRLFVICLEVSPSNAF